MNGEPFIPLPKQRHNEPLTIVQLMMLWLMWACGMAAGIIAFLVELKAGVKEKHKDVRKIAWAKIPISIKSGQGRKVKENVIVQEHKQRVRESQL